MEQQVLSDLNKARRSRRAAIVVRNLTSGEQEFLTPENFSDHILSDQISARLKSGKSGVTERDGTEYFIEVHVPPPRLVVIGAVHISQALYPMAQECGFDVTIIDPRTAFATPDRFGDVTLLAQWPQEVLETTPLDAYTAVAALTHDPKIDDIPLQQALQAGCFYIGALGSRKTHAKRQDRLREAGLDDALLGTIHAPIGLDIGAASPAEIAVAVLAEIVQALRKGRAGV